MKRNESTLTLIVINSTSGGGAENSMMQISEELRKRAVPVAVCALNGGPDSQLKGDYILERKWKAGIIETFKTFIEFRLLVQKLRPTTIVANCELPEMYVAFAAPKFAKVICVEHTSNPWVGRRALGIVVRNILNLRKTKWVTVSSDAMSIWRGSQNPLHIANPIVIPGEETFQGDKPTELVFIGRLRPEKRPEWLISAAIKAELAIDIFGDGNQKEILKERFSDVSNLKFHGFVAKPWQYVSRDSLVVVPSEYEGDGMVVAEAILRGHAILLADNPDLRRFGLPEENYFLNEDELLSKILAWKKSDRKSSQVPDSVIKSLYTARDFNTIVKQWEYLLIE
jgi:glycosyltransferase involved in cell wall biosynthesis